MATGKLTFDEGTTTNVATYTITEDALSKHINRTVLNTEAGVEVPLATSTKQDTIIGHLDGVEGLLTTIDADTGNIATSTASIDGKITACNTGAVVVSSSALPTGASTSAAQTTGNNSLSSIDGKITACNTGAVVISSGTVTSLTQMNGQAIAMGTGVRTAGTQRVTIATDDVVPVSQSGSWSVTANAGTNLNTSALALESGGNLAAIAASTSILDDWDDGADRAKIVGAVAHDAAVAGNPILQGIEARTSRQTAVANGDVSRANGDVYGRAFNIVPAVTQTSSNGTAITTATNTSAVAAPSAGNHLRIYRLWAQNSSATGTWLYWTEGSGGTKKYPMYLAQNQALTIRLNGEWELPTATALFINTATSGANIEWHVGHETVID